MNKTRGKTSLIQQARAKKKAYIMAYLKEAFKEFDCPVYLFGSYATGQFHGHSDVDILIVSPEALSGKYYREACDKMSGIDNDYDILMTTSINKLDKSIVDSLQQLKTAVMQDAPTEPYIHRHPGPHHQTGMTLIEIMIALLIGAFLLSGVLQIFISSKQTNRMQEGLSRMQENGRFAATFISKDMRRAGFMGCPSLRSKNDNGISKVIPNVVAAVPSIPALSEDTLISGANNILENWDANACGAGSVCIAGTDAISVTYAESCGGNLSAAMANVNADIQILASNTCSINATWALLASNCSSVDIFRATNNATTTIQHPALNNAYAMDSELFIYRAYTYFIRESTSGAPNRSLWRLDNTKATSGSNPVELIEGIEDMQILYGVDGDDDDNGDGSTTAPDGPANYYVSADNIPDVDGNGAPDWYRVISIRVSLLAVSLDDNLSEQPVPYTYNGVTTTPIDRKIRRVFNTTIVLRNRLP